MHWKGGRYPPPPPPGRPAYAQPLPPERQVPASMAFVTDSNRPQPLWQPPPTACLTACGVTSEVLSRRRGNAPPPPSLQCLFPTAVPPPHPPSMACPPFVVIAVPAARCAARGWAAARTRDACRPPPGGRSGRGSNAGAPAHRRLGAACGPTQATALWRPWPLPGVGWVGQRPAKRFLSLKSTSNSGPCDKFHFCPGENFSDVGGCGGVRSRSPGRHSAPLPPPPPP